MSVLSAGDEDEASFHETKEIHDEMEEQEEEETLSLKEDFFNKNTSSFRCLAQVFLSSSSLMRHALYHFPVLEDPGLDDAFYYCEPEVVVDDVGVETYLTKCREYEIVPISRVVNSLPTNRLNLKYYGVTLKQVKAITAALRQNRHVLEVIFEDNWLEPEAGEMLAQMLVENKTITKLNLKECRIGPEGALLLNRGLEATQTLEELDLSFNSLGNEGLVALCEGLISNGSIMKLNLSRNQLSEACGEELGNVLGYNETIEELDLSWNELYTALGWKEICKGLIENTTIRSLNLAWNGIGQVRESVLPLVKFIKKSEKLERLDMSNNRLCGPSFSLIRNAVNKSESLKWVDLSYNVITPDNALSATKMLLTRPLEHLGLNCFVEKEFMETKRSVQKHGKTVDIEGVICNYAIHGPDIKKMLLERVRYIGLKAKKAKAKKDFGNFLYTLPGVSISKDDFTKALLAFKLKKVVKDKDLVNLLMKTFADRNIVDCVKMLEQYKVYYPDAAPLPPKPKKEKKKKGKGKGKGKVAPVFEGEAGGEKPPEGGEIPPAEGKEAVANIPPEGEVPPAEGQEAVANIPPEGEVPSAEGEEAVANIPPEGEVPPAEGQEAVAPIPPEEEVTAESQVAEVADEQPVTETTEIPEAAAEDEAVAEEPPPEEGAQ